MLSPSGSVFIGPVFDDPRDSEEAIDGIGGVGQHLLGGEARPWNVVAHHVHHGHGVAGGLDSLRVEGAQGIDVGQDLGQLLLHASLLGVGEVQAGEPRHVIDVDLHSSSRGAYWSDKRLRPTLAKRTVTTVSSPSRSTPTTSPSPKRPWRTRAPTFRGNSSSRSSWAGGAGSKLAVRSARAAF